MSKSYSSFSGTAQQSLKPDFAQFEACARAGHTIIPLKGKSPLDRGWSKRSYDRRDVLRRCRTRGLNAGFRIPTNVAVFDVDMHGCNGLESYQDFCFDYGFHDAKHHRVLSGSGGKHVYGVIPKGFSVSTTLPGYPGVQIRRVGMQMVLPGSVHPSTGKLYRFEDDSPRWSTPLLPFPATIFELIAAPAREEREAVPPGQCTPNELAHMLGSIDVHDFVDPDLWEKMMMASHAATNGDGEAEFISWCVGDKKKRRDPEEIASRWRSLTPDKIGGVTARTLFKFVQDFGDVNTIPEPTNAAEDFESADDPEFDTTQDDPPRSALSFEVAADVKPEPINWLWDKRFAVGKLSIIAGFPDQGKSLLTMDIASRVSRGAEWPNGEGNAAQGAVIIFSAEDDKADTIRPRLEAAGADLNQCLLLSSIVKVDSGSRVFNLADDLTRLADFIRERRKEGRPIRLVIIDPISAYMGGRSKGDTHKNSDVRAMLTPLTEWAAKFGVAVIAISHFNKGGSGSAVYRVTDSLAFTAAARSVWLAVKEPGTERPILVKGKHNIADDPGGLAYSIEGVEIESGINAPRIVWEDGRVETTADEALGQTDRAPTASKAAEDFLFWFLSDGAKPEKEIQEAARAAGHSEITIKRAKKRLGIISSKSEFRDGWQWSLPPVGDDFDEGGQDPAK